MRSHGRCSPCRYWPSAGKCAPAAPETQDARGRAALLRGISVTKSTFRSALGLSAAMAELAISAPEMAQETSTTDDILVTAHRNHRTEVTEGGKVGTRSEARRSGKERLSTCRTRW